MVGRALALAAAALLSAGACHAADIDVSASVNRTTVGVGEELVLTVTVTGGFQNLPSPDLPELADFNVYASGSSTNFSFVNGRVTSSKTSRYVLVPKVEGALVIPEIAVQHKGREHLTEPIEITVTSAGAPSPLAQPPSGVEGGAILLKASVDKTRAYVSQQVTLTLRFYRRVGLASSRLIPPATTGFWVEELPGEKNFYEVEGGLQYRVTEIAMALFPTTHGVLEIGPAVWECVIRERVDPLKANPFKLFGRTRTREASVRSDTLTVEVLPLPEQGRPKTFGGAVGLFDLSARVDKTAVRTEEPLTFTVTLSGRGNIAAVGEIDMPDIAGFRSYDSGGSTDLSKGGGVVRGTKSFSTVYIPSATGEYEIPVINLAYFDPSEGSYATASTKPVKITVAPGEGGPAEVTDRGAPGDIFAKDIRYIKTETPSFSHAGDRLYTRRRFLLLQLLAPAMVAGAYLFRVARERAGSDPARSRARRARREASMRLGAARSLADGADYENAWKALAGALRGYIADITNTSSQGLTMEDAAAYLGALGTPPDLITDSLSVLERCDAAAFAPRGEVTDNPGKVIQKTSRIIERLERVRKDR